ncbi:MAG: hypothetical protein ACHQT8_01820 [Chlamydiales bacterium]
MANGFHINPNSLRLRPYSSDLELEWAHLPKSQSLLIYGADAVIQSFIQQGRLYNAPSPYNAPSDEQLSNGQRFIGPIEYALKVTESFEVVQDIVRAGVVPVVFNRAHEDHALNRALRDNSESDLVRFLLAAKATPVAQHGKQLGTLDSAVRWSTFHEETFNALLAEGATPSAQTLQLARTRNERAQQPVREDGEPRLNAIPEEFLQRLAQPAQGNGGPLANVAVPHQVVTRVSDLYNALGRMTREELQRYLGRGGELRQPLQNENGFLDHAVNTPACAEGMITLLIDRGAKPCLPNENNEGTLATAIRRGRSEDLILRILQAGGRLGDETGIMRLESRNPPCSQATLIRLRAEFLPPAQPARAEPAQQRYCGCFDGILPAFLVNILESICSGAVSICRRVYRYFEDLAHSNQ